MWRNSVKAPEAANALKLTGEHLIKFGIVDEVIPEPLGGAHKNPEQVAADLKSTILKYIQELSSLSLDELVEQRYAKFRSIGEFIEP